MSERTVDYRVLPDGSLRAEPTPGPWQVEREDDQLLILAGRLYLACIPDPDDEDEANARLIARSPTLRAALQQIRDGLVARDVDASNGGLGRAYAAAVDAISTAVLTADLALEQAGGVS